MARLFGTDGVRGVAGEELSYELAVALGRAAVRKLGGRIVIGRDTRVSGPMLEEMPRPPRRCVRYVSSVWRFT